MQVAVQVYLVSASGGAGGVLETHYVLSKSRYVLRCDNVCSTNQQALSHHAVLRGSNATDTEPEVCWGLQGRRHLKCNQYETCKAS